MVQGKVPDLELVVALGGGPALQAAAHLLEVTRGGPRDRDGKHSGLDRPASDHDIGWPHLLVAGFAAGVHPRLAHQIGMQLVGLCEGGMTVIMVEHELSIMDEFCDPVIVLAKGRLLAEGTMTSLRAKEEVVEAYLVG